MKLADLIPDVDALLALEPEELGLRILAVLASQPEHNQIELDAFMGSATGNPRYPGSSSQYPPNRTADIKRALREAWAWLEGAALLIPHPGFLGNHTIRMLSRRAIRLADDPDPKRMFGSRRLPREDLNPRLREDVWALYHRGEYETAVFVAMKAVEVSVREAANLEARDIGTNLMRKAFDPDNGALTDKTTERAEREARSHLFSGSIGLYKNPHSHRNVPLDDPDEAAEIITLANHLLRIVDARAELRSQSVTEGSEGGER